MAISLWDAMNVTIRIAQSSATDRISGFYETWRYAAGIKPEDTASLPEAAGEPIGVVRIAPENGVLVLRGMRTAEQWQKPSTGLDQPPGRWP